MNKIEENSEKSCIASSTTFFTESIRNIGLQFQEVKSDFKLQETTLKEQFEKNHKWHDRIELKVFSNE